MSAPSSPIRSSSSDSSDMQLHDHTISADPIQTPIPTPIPTSPLSAYSDDHTVSPDPLDTPIPTPISTPPMPAYSDDHADSADPIHTPILTPLPTPIPTPPMSAYSDSQLDRASTIKPLKSRRTMTYPPCSDTANPNRKQIISAPRPTATTTTAAMSPPTFPALGQGQRLGDVATSALARMPVAKDTPPAPVLAGPPPVAKKRIRRRARRMSLRRLHNAKIRIYQAIVEDLEDEIEELEARVERLERGRIKEDVASPPVSARLRSRK